MPSLRKAIKDNTSVRFYVHLSFFLHHITPYWATIHKNVSLGNDRQRGTDIYMRQRRNWKKKSDREKIRETDRQTENDSDSETQR